MPNLKDRITALLLHSPGLSDRQITDALYGEAAIQQPVNQACRQMTAQGILTREKVGNKPIGNYLKDAGRSVGIESIARLPVSKASWPDWKLPTEEDLLRLATITIPYVRFLHPEIVQAVVEDNAAHMETWAARLRDRNIDPSLYLWERTACTFPGVRRHAGSTEVAIHHGRSTLTTETAHALKLDDNHYPKMVWSFVFRGKPFQNQGPVGYALAHLADHKQYKNRGREEFDGHIDGSSLPVSFGLFTSVANAVYLPVGLIKPTDFSFALRNVLQRQAQKLYGDFCNLLPPPARVRDVESSLWSLDAFDWAEPVGSVDNVPAFLKYRNQEMERLFGVKGAD